MHRRPRSSIFTMIAILVGSGLVGLVAAGCTFGGLANYTIQICVPGKPQADDICNQLPSSDPCMSYQCDATRRCVQAIRDDDRDGDPPKNCGGTDCDDANPARNGKAKEICDRVDNNCNDLVDEEPVEAGAARIIASNKKVTSSADPILVPSDDARRNALAAFIAKPTCISFVALEPGGVDVGSECTISVPVESPHQAFPFRTNTQVNAAAFVASSVCPAGRLAYRAQSSLDMPCDATHPAALPSVAAMPSTANANSGIIAWYEAPFTERTDPIGGCASLKSAPFAVLPVATLATPPANPTQSDVRLATEKSAATRPAALLAIESAGGMLVATPLGNDVGVWLLTPASLGGATLPPPTRVPLTNAHATALAAHVDKDGKVNVAIAAEIGCRPQASIQLLLGTLDAANAYTLKIVGVPIEVAPAGDTTVASVAWVDGGSEWRVGWVDGKPKAHLRRFDTVGTPIGGVIDVGTNLFLASVSSNGSVFGLDPTVVDGSFVEIPVGCPK